MRIGDIIVVAAAAGVGGGLRYVIGVALAERWGSSFPWHTLAVNLSGAFLLGVLMALSAERGIIPETWRLALSIGLLGGFTTFSTLAYESVVLAEQGRYIAALGNTFGSGAAGLIAAVAGLAVGRVL